MFNKLFQKLTPQKNETKKAEYSVQLSANLKETVSSISSIIKESDDMIQRDLKIGRRRQATLFYIESMCDTQALEQEIIKPLIQVAEEQLARFESSTAHLLSFLTEEVISKASFSIVDSFEDAVLPLMSGNTLLLIDGVEQMITLETTSLEKRGVEEPETEVVIRGPRDCFTETIETNISLIRRKVRDPQLIVQKGELGRRSKRKFALLYMRGITSPELVDEARYRISCIDIDNVPETGTVEQLIEDHVLSPFPQIGHTERPDKTVSALLNGQVIILIDGTPFSLFAPITFHQLFKSPEDYYDRWLIGSLIRLLRFVSAFISLFLPALYIAMVSFHQGLIPTKLALSIAGSREGIPFPALAEALIMETTFEMLREAGNRLPRPIGQTVGIVGGLIIGDAAVRAGIVSPIMVIVVSLTAISSFTLPSYSVSISFRILRFGVMLAAGIFGLFGITMIFICICIHLVGLRSFGSPYLSPLAPYRFLDWLDFVLRAPLNMLQSRTNQPKTLDNKKQD